MPPWSQKSRFDPDAPERLAVHNNGQSDIGNPKFRDYRNAMITTVTRKNMVTIPAAVGRKFGIKPGWKLDWVPVEGSEEMRVRVIPDRGELARRLLGSGRKHAPRRDGVAELIAERESEG